MSKTRQEQLDLRLASHKKFVETNGKEGERFNGSNEDFSGLNFKNANLENAILTGAILEGAKYNSATVFSDGFKPEKRGMININEE